jgi:HD superfamily phosphohydrolase
MSKWFLLILLPFAFSCQNSSNEEVEDTEKPYFPIKSYILSQIADVDSSVYSIRRIETQNNRSDTAFIKREEFREQAKDFLEIPDITQKKWKKDYRENKSFDETLQIATISYWAKEDDAEIRRQEVIIKPNLTLGDQVKTIYIDRLFEDGSSTVQQRMLWEVDNWFKVTTITQKPNQPEQIKTLQVIWGVGPSAE